MTLKTAATANLPVKATAVIAVVSALGINKILSSAIPDMAKSINVTGRRPIIAKSGNGNRYAGISVTPVKKLYMYRSAEKLSTFNAAD